MSRASEIVNTLKSSISEREAPLSPENQAYADAITKLVRKHFKKLQFNNASESALGSLVTARVQYAGFDYTTASRLQKFEQEASKVIKNAYFFEVVFSSGGTTALEVEWQHQHKK